MMRQVDGNGREALNEILQATGLSYEGIFMTVLLIGSAVVLWHLFRSRGR